MKEVENNTFKYELCVQREMFYNEQSMWGVYSFTFANAEDMANAEVKLDPKWGNFVISGEVFNLTVGETYTVEFEESYTERYGEGYAFVNVHSEGLKKRSAQVEFLYAVLPESIAEDIDFKHPHNETLLSDILSNKINLLDIKRVTENNIDTYKEAIASFNDYQEAIVFLAPLGVNINTIKKLADHANGARRLLHLLHDNIYELTNFEGFGFKRVDEYALKLGYQRSSKYRILSGSEYVLQQMSTFGDIKIPIESFDSEMCKILEVEEITDEIFSEIVDSSKFYYSEGYISLTKYRNEELEIAKRLIDIQQNAKPLEGFKEAFDKVIEELEEKNGFAFTEEQRKAIGLIEHNGVMVINGVAGSGKSAITKAITNIIQELRLSYVAGALSGKASQVLVQNGLHNASTVHRMLKWNPQSGFTRNEEEPLLESLTIIDEASMINNSLYVSILRAQALGNRILFIGDSGQLPPIGHGALFDNLLKLDIPRVELTKVHRQAAKSGIITTANKIRNHEQINTIGTSDVQVIGEMEDMRVFNYIDKTDIYDDVMTTVKRFNDNPMKDAKDIQVITAMKKGNLGVPKLNKGMQDILNPHPKHTHIPHIVHKGIEFRKNDRVIQNGNNYNATKLRDLQSIDEFKKIHRNKDIQQGSLNNLNDDMLGIEDETELVKISGVFNGSIGYIKEVIKEDYLEGLLVEFTTMDTKKYFFYHNHSNKQELGMLDLAYAVTVHRSQGSGFDTVIFAFDYSAFMLLSKEFVYTGVTRAINHCLMFVENTALHYAIKRTQSANRKTYIKDFLENKF